MHTFDVAAAERSVAELREALKISREVLEETESRFNAVSEQRADVQNALVDADRLREKMQSANLYAQSAEKELLRVQNALSNVQQKRLNVAQEKARVDEERQRVEAQIAEKRLLVDKLSEQIEGAKQKEREIMKQVRYQQQLLDKQLEQTRTKLSENVSQAEKELLEVKGGDSSRSEMSLQEIKRNLRAEKLALSAEIRQARVASDALSEEDVDKLQLLKREMKAKRDGMRAKLKKAQTTVDREEKEIERREAAIGNILDVVDNDDEESLMTVDVAAPDTTDAMKKSVRRGKKKEVFEQDVSADGDSETTAKEGRKSVAEDEAMEDTLDSSEGDSKVNSVKAASTSATKEVKKRTRTRKRASSGGSGSATTDTKTRKRKATRKKRSEMNGDEPLTAQEAMEVRKAMIDILGNGAEVADLPQSGPSAVAGIVGEKGQGAEGAGAVAADSPQDRRSAVAGSVGESEQGAEGVSADDEAGKAAKSAKRPQRRRRSAAADGS
ncbi:Exosome complex exonuclease-like protein [Gracilaria domingensis]|nr:Exosome complex exonuclease-like protein [Gracilaria domingensis]